MDEQEELEMERTAGLQQERLASEEASRRAKKAAPKQDGTPKQRISTLELGLMAGFLGMFFDLPQMLLAVTFIGIAVSWIIGFMGYLTLYIWLKIKGRSLFDAQQGSKRLFTFWGSAVVDTASGGFLPGLAGCVFGMMIIERLEELAEKRGGGIGALAKKAL